MDLATIIAEVSKNPAFIAVYLAVIASFGNFVLGSVRAWANGTFQWGAWSAWVGKDGPKILGPTVFVIFGYLVGLVDASTIGVPTDLLGAGLVSYGVIQLASFIVTSLASLRDSIAPPSPTVVAERAEQVAKAEGIGDPIPQP